MKKKRTMSDYAALVSALYQYHKTWQAVADECNSGHSPTLYWKIAKRKIRKPGVLVRRGIVEACYYLPKSILPSVTLARMERTVCGLTVNRKTWNRIRTWKNERGLTWNQWMETAQDLMEEG